MRISVILGHPRPGSLCHAITGAVVARLEASRHTVLLHDLQAERFDPVMSADELTTRMSTDTLVEQHCRELAMADGVVVVHPNWWGGPPAIMKGWIDRVMRPGVAYELRMNSGGGGEWFGLLRVKGFVVFNTGIAPADAESTRFGDTLNGLWRMHIAALCKLPMLERHAFGGMPASTNTTRGGWLREAADITGRVFPPG